MLKSISLVLNLSEAWLEQSDLEGGKLIGVNLRNASLRFANLREADLTGADLSGADLCGADLRWANLTDAVFLNTVDAYFDQAILCNTVMPDGSIASSDGAGVDEAAKQEGVTQGQETWNDAMTELKRRLGEN